MKLSQYLRRAQCLLREVGWHKGSFHRVSSRGEATSMCALGALYRSASGTLSVHAPVTPEMKTIYGELTTEVGADLHKTMGYESIAGWNDRRARNAEEVCELFETTAQRLEKENR